MKVDITKCIDEVAAVTNSLASRQTETETRIAALEDDVALLKGRLTALLDKVSDLEGCSRRDNIRILGVS